MILLAVRGEVKRRATRRDEKYNTGLRDIRRDGHSY